MIFYFSGTGNSLWVAKELQKYYRCKVISIAEELNRPENNFSYAVASSEYIFFVFPVHSWGADILTCRFLEKLNLVNYRKQPVYVICTCGDNCGYTAKVIKRILRKKSIALTKSYSIQMPNNYLLMKGFSTDTKEIETQKLAEAPKRLQLIVNEIPGGDCDDLYAKGKFSCLKTYLIYPLFRKYGVKKNLFYAKEICVSCGLCMAICPTKTIYYQDKKPKWNQNTCVQCSACINRCPEQAIEYGTISETKGRYHHPDL